MRTVFIAILSVVLSVIAQFLLKAGMASAEVKAAVAQPIALRVLFTVLSNKFVLTGFAAYGIGAIVWLAVLAKWDVSKAYPMVGLGFSLTAIFGLIIGEQVNFLRIAGIALICTGVLLVGRS